MQDVAEKMLADGHARVSAQTGDRACTARLLALENAARNAKLGLWGEPVLCHSGGDSGADALGQRGHFTVVEGKVLSVRESGGTIYMNFGRRWSQALTVTIWKRHERIFAAAGSAPRRPGKPPCSGAWLDRGTQWAADRGPGSGTDRDRRAELTNRNNGRQRHIEPTRAWSFLKPPGCARRRRDRGPAARRLQLGPARSPAADTTARTSRNRPSEKNVPAASAREHQRILAAYNGAYTIRASRRCSTRRSPSSWPRPSGRT